MNKVEAPNKKPRCQFISKIGARCQADPQTGKAYCFFHDPDQKSKQAAARRQGGEARSRQTEPEPTLPPDLPAVRLENAGNVFDLLAVTVNHLRCGQMDVRVAQAIAYLASLVLRALKAHQPIMAHLLSDTINEVRRGETDLRTAKTIGHLTSIMLTALKQEAQEEEAASIVEMGAIRPAEAPRPAEAMRANSLAPNFAGEAPRQESIGAVITPLVAAKLPDDHKPHAAVINGMAAANTADHPQARHA